MKFTIFLSLLCLGVCIAAEPKVTLWGTETQNLIGSKKIKVDSSFLQVKEYTFTFPEVNLGLRKSFENMALKMFSASKIQCH